MTTGGDRERLGESVRLPCPVAQYVSFTRIAYASRMTRWQDTQEAQICWEIIPDDPNEFPTVESIPVNRLFQRPAAVIS
jgi:hypothetical protein